MFHQQLFSWSFFFISIHGCSHSIVLCGISSLAGVSMDDRWKDDIIRAKKPWEIHSVTSQLLENEPTIAWPNVSFAVNWYKFTWKIFAPGSKWVGEWFYFPVFLPCWNLDIACVLLTCIVVKFVSLLTSCCPLMLTLTQWHQMFENKDIPLYFTKFPTQSNDKCIG